MSDTPITIAVLAGGSSRRMGHDKAAAIVRGRPMLENVLRAALDGGMRVMVVGRDRPGWIEGLEEVEFLPDDSPGSGPLGGIATALRRGGKAVLALPCDMPDITADAIRWLLEEATGQSGRPDIVIVRNGERLEPLFAIYSPALLPQIDAMLARGHYKLRDLLEQADCRYVDAPAWLIPQLLNVNDEVALQALRDGPTAEGGRP